MRGAPTVLAPSAVRLLGTSESIAQVRDLEVLSDGAVWLLNSVEPFFIGFEADGSLIREYGNAGGGPEEFLLPSAFVAGGIKEGVWVLDVRRHALIEISQSTDERSEISLRHEAIPTGSLAGGMSMLSSSVRTVRLGDDILLPRTHGSPRESGYFTYRMAILMADLVALNPDSEVVREFVALGDVLGDPSADFELTDGGFPLWYRLWAACGDDHVRIYDRAANQVRGFAPDGAELDPVALPPVGLRAATPRQFARAIYGLRAAEVAGGVGRRLTSEDSLRILNEIVEGVEGDPTQLANYLPRYVDLRCSDEGVIWIRPLDVDRGGLSGGPAWLRLDLDGTMREIHLPSGFDAFRFTSERIWGVQRDDLDVASIAWINISEAL